MGIDPNGKPYTSFAHAPGPSAAAGPVAAAAAAGDQVRLLRGIVPLLSMRQLQCMLASTSCLGSSCTSNIMLFRMWHMQTC